MTPAPSDPRPSVPLVNLANGLTGFRLLLVPVFGWLLLADDGDSAGLRVAAAVVFVVASITDRIDGQVARSRGQVTDFGTVADPIADKALIGAALVGLSLLGELPWLVTLVVLARELGVTLLRFVVIRHGVLPVSRGGKLKTALQVLAITLYLLPLTGAAATGRAVVMAAAVVLTVVTGADYVARAVALRRGSARTRRKRAGAPA